jgi:hypothetical protein
MKTILSTLIALSLLAGASGGAMAGIGTSPGKPLPGIGR